MVEILIVASDGAQLPTYTTPGAAGADVRAFLTDTTTLQPGERRLIPTGLFMEIPPGFEVQVRPRSGLAFKHGITVCNAPGTIDSDYRGELGVLLINLGQNPFTIEPQMRIAQLVVAPAPQAHFVTGALASSERGAGGFGHTGVS